jgi:hypothetical protein
MTFNANQIGILKIQGNHGVVGSPLNAGMSVLNAGANYSKGKVILK